MKTLLLTATLLLLTGCSTLTDQVIPFQGAKTVCQKHGVDWQGMPESWGRVCRKKGWYKL